MTAAIARGRAHLADGHGLGGRARRDGLVRRGAALALSLSLLLVSSWWMAGGGVTDLAGWESGLNSTGRLAGLLAADLMLVQVLMMARIPILERAFGQDRLAHLHRLVGFASFNLLVAHIVLIVWGYASGNIQQAPATSWQLTIDYPGMLLAVAGTACLVMVVVTSVRAARRRMRYESWHLIHLYGYLGAGLALPHQLWNGQDFRSSAAATLYWWSIWSLALVAVLVFRLGIPAWRSLRHRVRVTSVAHEGDGVVSVYMSGRHLHRLGAEAGQFFVWRFLGGHGGRGNPYSLSAAPDGRSLRVTVKSLGDASDAAAGIRPGTPVALEGPYGRLSARTRTRFRLAFIGAGVGVTPLRALAEGLDYAPGEAVMLHRFTDVPILADELQTLGAERGLRTLWLPGRRRRPDSWLGDHGDPDDTKALLEWVPDIAERDVYLCGPDAWTSSVRLTLNRAGVPVTQVHVENFRW